jgi:hypothetical protein
MTTRALRPSLEREGQVERIAFRGHPMVSALHPTTIEITTEEHLTANGDCIVGVGAEKGCAQLQQAVKAAIKRGSTTVRLRISVGPDSFVVMASGDPRLTLTHPHEIVVRKSEFISDRTIAVRASAAAKDIPRPMVARLRDPRTVGFFEVEAL